MAFTGWTKTEDNPGAKTNGWLWIKTCLNNAATPSSAGIIQPGVIPVPSSGSAPSVDTDIYCHQDEPTEPSGDGSILTDVFDDSTTEYSGGQGFVKYFTSEESFITVNQDYSDSIYSGLSWTIYYNAKFSDVPSGKVAVIRFYFYKRDSDNNDTLMFQAEKVGGFGAFYNAVGYSLSVAPYDWTGYADNSITTDDRLRIGVYFSYSLPM